MCSACGSKYQGFWCRYNETATIIVLLNDDNSEKDRNKIEETISNFENVTSMNFYTKEDYAEELGEDVNTMDIYDCYVIMFDSIDYIGDYIKTLEKGPSIKEVRQANAKTNISLYELKKHGKYTYTNSDEANEEDIVNGKFIEKSGVIVFTPNEKGASQSFLYIKNGHLCEDAECTKIFSKSNKTCEATE